MANSPHCYGVTGNTAVPPPPLLECYMTQWALNQATRWRFRHCYDYPQLAVKYGLKAPKSEHSPYSMALKRTEWKLASQTFLPVQVQLVERREEKFWIS